MPSSPVASLDFRRACAKFGTGVTVVTCLDPEGNPQGMTANSFTSVSLDPPLVLFCVDRDANIAPMLTGAPCFGINILRKGQEQLSNRFAFLNADRFEGVPWSAGETGAPILSGILASLECRQVEHWPAGDHFIVLGEVVSSQTSSGEPLLYFDSAYRSLSAPQPDQAEVRSSALEDGHISP